MAVTNWLMDVGAHHRGSLPLWATGASWGTGAGDWKSGQCAQRLGRGPLTARAPWTKRESLAVFMDS